MTVQNQRSSDLLVLVVENKALQDDVPVYRGIMGRLVSTLKAIEQVSWRGRGRAIRPGKVHRAAVMQPDCLLLYGNVYFGMNCPPDPSPSPLVASPVLLLMNAPPPPCVASSHSGLILPLWPPRQFFSDYTSKNWLVRVFSNGDDAAMFDQVCASEGVLLPLPGVCASEGAVMIFCPSPPHTLPAPFASPQRPHHFQRPHHLHPPLLLPLCVPVCTPHSPLLPAPCSSGAT